MDVNEYLEQKQIEAGFRDGVLDFDVREVSRYTDIVDGIVVSDSVVVGMGLISKDHALDKGEEI